MELEAAHQGLHFLIAGPRFHPDFKPGRQPASRLFYDGKGKRRAEIGRSVQARSFFLHRRLGLNGMEAFKKESE
jgi:hypothetical protein